MSNFLTPKVYHSLEESEQKEAQQIYLKSDLMAFCHFLGYTDVNKHTHEEIITALESPHKRKLITVPRGAFKSSIASIAYPIWKLLRDPNERILIDSEVFSNAVTYLRSIKTHIQSADFIEMFGDITGDPWQESNIQVRTRTKNYKEPSITCGGVATTKVGQHYSTIIGDDYNSRENSKTREAAMKVVDHYRYNLNILEPDGEYVIIGTRYSEDDLIGFILREQLNQMILAEGKFDEWK